MDLMEGQEQKQLKGIEAATLKHKTGSSQTETPQILVTISYKSKKVHGSAVWQMNLRLNTVLVSIHSTELKSMA